MNWNVEYLSDLKRNEIQMVLTIDLKKICGIEKILYVMNK